MMNTFPDIPRIYTALAESAACCIIAMDSLKHLGLKKGLLRILILLCAQMILQLFAGQLPLIFWIPGILLNIVWMFLSIRLLGVSKLSLQLYQTAKSFIAAELVASVSWHLYCLLLYKSPYDSGWSQASFMFLFGGLTLSILYWQNRKLSTSDLESIIEIRDVYTACFTSLAIFVLSNSGFLLNHTEQFRDSTSIFILRTTINVSGILLLLTQETLQHERYLKEELTSIHSMFQLQYKQYQAYQENSEMIGRKVHDLKHQLAILEQEADHKRRQRYFSEINEAIQNFEAKVNTGNPVLDTILTQKNHYCLHNDINFTCLVNGAGLDFMDVIDLSTLIGNAIDNAIEAVEKISNLDQRLITVKIAPYSQFMVFRFDNYFPHHLQDHLADFPTTSKKDKEAHGYGLKSMDYIAKKYGGHMTFRQKGDWVHVKILIPTNSSS
ncbi:ATP-binding protein [Streptococcus sp. DD13]|uniref:ATP-binding protein n=1 Tax=Streptococcus sp. DD13 TaxID=1777881 RepID=UPI000798B853|nr:ATP-binding protein [Streptococcus sp. DD13]KXT79026.1 hypothetical protein STRDD13_00282 [Streptococcus sp. DD13]